MNKKRIFAILIIVLVYIFAIGTFAACNPDNGGGNNSGNNNSNGGGNNDGNSEQTPIIQVTVTEWENALKIENFYNVTITMTTTFVPNAPDDMPASVTAVNKFQYTNLSTGKTYLQNISGDDMQEMYQESANGINYHYMKNGDVWNKTEANYDMGLNTFNDQTLAALREIDFADLVYDETKETYKISVSGNTNIGGLVNADITFKFSDKKLVKIIIAATDAENAGTATDLVITNYGTTIVELPQVD